MRILYPIGRPTAASARPAAASGAGFSYGPGQWLPTLASYYFNAASPTLGLGGRGHR